MRIISTEFMNELLCESGILNPLLNRIRNDSTLMLGIRTDCINIYYRGGNVCRVERKRDGTFRTSFDSEYNKIGLELPELPAVLKSAEDSRKWVRSFPVLKDLMDCCFGVKNKLEREFQQLVVRENNYSPISAESEYFITDIEFADSDLGARFDLLAIQWLSSHRKQIERCRPVFIEMKYGDKALENDSGILAHMRDFNAFIENRDSCSALLEVMSSQFNQLDQLGLIKYNRSSAGTTLSLSGKEKPVVMFLFANHNPRSSKLKTILTSSEFRSLIRDDLYDLRFFCSTFAGYSMHEKSMLTLDQFIELL